MTPSPTPSATTKSLEEILLSGFFQAIKNATDETFKPEDAHQMAVNMAHNYAAAIENYITQERNKAIETATVKHAAEMSVLDQEIMSLKAQLKKEEI